MKDGDGTKNGGLSKQNLLLVGEYKIDGEMEKPSKLIGLDFHVDPSDLVENDYSRTKSKQFFTPYVRSARWNLIKLLICT